ncbi:MAG: phosphate-starvation-inducible PsiE family protein [Pseudomonadales bacterium]|nr:phosphate-starvation-inducible PsiE family protein [Pseudomonadales bacterium]
MTDNKVLHEDEPLVQRLKALIHWAVRALAILMVFVILMGVVDVGWTLYQKLMAPPKFILNLSDILAIFGAFMAVLIAIEIFVNITIYLREDIIHVKIVLATALMAVARKVIILDIDKVEAPYLIGLASIVFALAIAYWLVIRLPKFDLANWEGIADRQPPDVR